VIALLLALGEHKLFYSTELNWTADNYYNYYYNNYNVHHGCVVSEWSFVCPTSSHRFWDENVRCSSDASTPSHPHTHTVLCRKMYAKIFPEIALKNGRFFQMLSRRKLPKTGKCCGNYSDLLLQVCTHLKISGS